jgi:hypothetical protein
LRGGREKIVRGAADALCYISRDTSGLAHFARREGLARVLYIVSRENPALYNHLRATLETATVEVIFDRRSGERRQGGPTPEIERRASERRTRSIVDELERTGWAEIRIDDTRSTDGSRPAASAAPSPDASSVTTEEVV